MISGQTREYGELVFAALPLLELQTDKLSFDDPKRVDIIKMYTLAGRKALESSVFDVAASNLRKALDLIVEDPFSEHHQLCVQIHTMAAAAEFVTGNLGNVETYCESVLNMEDLPLMDKLPACYTMMDFYENTVNSDANYKLGKKMLKQFGRRFPKGTLGITAKTLGGLLRAKMRLKKQLSKEEIDKQDITTDPKTLGVMRLLDKFASAVYHAKPDMLPLVLLESAKASEQLGMNAYSGAAYAFVGLIFCLFDDFET